MKKNYFKILLIAAMMVPCFSHTHAQQTIVIKNFNPDASGIIFNDEDRQLVVKTSNAQTKNVTLGISCLEFNNEFPALIFNSSGNRYIDIINDGENSIEKVEFIGSASVASSGQESKCIVAISTKGDGTFDTDLFREDISFSSAGRLPDRTNLLKTFSINFTDACNGDNIFTIPDIVYQGTIIQEPPRTQVSDFTKKVKMIRLAWGVTSLGGVNISGTTGSSPEIYGIKIYIKDTATNIQEENNLNDQQQEIIQQGNSIYCNQQADITIYNMAGQKVMQVKSAKQAELDNLNKGIYIIKAVSKINGHVFVKKISLV